LKVPISITAIRSISPLGLSLEETWMKYQDNDHAIKKTNLDGNEALNAPLTIRGRQEISALKNSDTKYKYLDDSVLFAIYASRLAVQQAGWKNTDNFGVNIAHNYFGQYLFLGST